MRFSSLFRLDVGRMRRWPRVWIQVSSSQHKQFSYWTTRFNLLLMNSRQSYSLLNFHYQRKSVCNKSLGSLRYQYSKQQCEQSKQQPYWWDWCLFVNTLTCINQTDHDRGKHCLNLKWTLILFARRMRFTVSLFNVTWNHCIDFHKCINSINVPWNFHEQLLPFIHPQRASHKSLSQFKWD